MACNESPGWSLRNNGCFERARPIHVVTKQIILNVDSEKTFFDIFLINLAFIY